MKIYKLNGGAMRLLFVSCFFLLSACHSGWQQDPFKKDPDNVKNAVPQGTKRPSVPPEVGAVFIDAKSNYSVKEGEELTIPATYRNTLGEKLTPIRVDVLGLEENLPGAVYDSQNQIITYKVPLDAVADGTVVSYRVFTISVLTEYEGLTQVYSKEVSVAVIKGSVSKPVIERIEGLGINLKEDQTAKFKVYVRDKDSLVAPTLTVLGNGVGSQSAGPFIDIEKGKQVSGETNLWLFTGVVDLPYNKIDITKTYTQLQASFIAYSEFGVPSDLEIEAFNVYTTASIPRFFLDSDVEFIKGQTNQYRFTVADTKAEGKVIATFKDSCNQLVGEHECSCKSLDSYASCFIRWTPEELGEVSLPLEATNTVNGSTLMKEAKTASSSLKIMVIE